MEIKVTNIFNNEALPEKGLKGSHGQAFLVSADAHKVLMDTGWKPDILLHNMCELGIDPDEIEKLVISHGHIDHTGGVVSILESRKAATPLPVIAHPKARESKGLKGTGNYLPIGFPDLPDKLQEKAEFILSEKPVEIFPGLFSMGEIPLSERNEKQGMETQAFHIVGNHWEWDPMIDELTLAIKSKDGLVILTGCCHAGILNTCAKATKIFKDKIHTVIGGTHMLRFTDEEIEHVGNVLEKDFCSPRLLINHCTGKKAFDLLKNKFGPEIVQEFLVGSEITFYQ